MTTSLRGPRDAGLRLAMAGAVLGALVACGSDVTLPDQTEPAHIEAVSGTNQAGAVGTMSVPVRAGLPGRFIGVVTEVLCDTGRLTGTPLGRGWPRHQRLTRESAARAQRAKVTSSRRGARHLGSVRSA